MTSSPPKGPPPDTITLGIRFQHMRLGGHRYSVYGSSLKANLRVETRHNPRAAWSIGLSRAGLGGGRLERLWSSYKNWAPAGSPRASHVVVPPGGPLTAGLWPSRRAGCVQLIPASFHTFACLSSTQADLPRLFLRDSPPTCLSP